MPKGVIPSGARDLLFAGIAVVLLAGCLFAASALAQKKPPKSPLDLNSASEKELAQLPGVGPVTAKSIVEFRKKGGPFRRVEDLLVVRGISANKLKQIRPYVFVKPATAPSKPAPAKPAAGAKP